MRQLVYLATKLTLAALLVCCSRAPASGTSASHEPAPHAAPAEPDPERYDEIVVVGTNDFHGYLRPVEADLGNARVVQGGAEWFAGYVNVLQAKFGDRLVLLDAGDMYQGTIDSNMFQGKSVEDYYNLLPYRALAVGNHEFDYGNARAFGRDGSGPPAESDKRSVLRQRMLESKHPFVQANIFYRKSGKPWTEKHLFPSVMVEAGGYKVGIIGLTTVNTPGTTLPLNVADLEFREFAASAQTEATKLRAKGADLVLVTTHEGDGTRAGDPIDKFLRSVPPGTIDAVVAGHTHTEAHLLVNGVPVIESLTRGIGFGRIDLFVDKQTRRIAPALTRIHGMQPVCGTWFKGEDACNAKAAKDAIAAGKARPEDYLPLRKPVYEGVEIKPSDVVRQTLAPYLAKADEKRREVLGTATADFERYPSGENQVGTFITDSFHFRFPEAKVVYMNGGGIRRMISKGTITYGDLYEVSPFDNVAVLVKMTGKQLKELVKTGTSGAHGVPAVWGIKVNYFNRDDAAFDRDVNGDGKKEKWERDRLDPVKGVVWEKTGKPVGDRETFWVATLDYLVAGGDNTQDVFKGIPMSRRKYFEVGPRDLMAEYLRKHPGIQVPRADEMRLSGIRGAGADPVFQH